MAKYHGERCVTCATLSSKLIQKRCRKNDDDGSLFVAFLKESRFPSEMKSVSWETIRDILEIYKVCAFIKSVKLFSLSYDTQFMPLCNKVAVICYIKPRVYFSYCDQDPIMSRLPLALAVEPRLLPYAVANGFCMDSKARLAASLADDALVDRDCWSTVSRFRFSKDV